MSTTPKCRSRKILSTKRRDDEVLEKEPTCTPVQDRVPPPDPDKDYSPLFLPCTQDSLDNVDVLWDWHSPQTKSTYVRKRRSYKVPSPKLLVKRQPASKATSTKAFEKLQKELKAFRDGLFESRHALDDDVANFDNPVDGNSNEVDDLFDDSIEQQLLLASQSVEQTLDVKVVEPNANTVTPRKLFTKSLSTSNFESPSRKATVARLNASELFNESVNFNDSLDMLIATIDDEDISKVDDKKHPDEAAGTSNSNMLKMKTKSLSFGDHYNATRVNEDRENEARLREEIERRRQEALAKLRAKQKQDLSDSDTSPVKCSPEEIELKRQRALAKLEAKKKQEIIDRNRREAQRKLQMKKMGLQTRL